jgi:hypothetical protein
MDDAFDVAFAHTKGRSRSMMIRRRMLPALLALALPVTACDTDPIAARGDDFTPRTSVTLPVAGHGTITSRFTAEVAVRGDWAYTTFRARSCTSW